MARSAHREAVEYVEHALSAFAHLPEQRNTREQAIDLRLGLRSALFLLGDERRILAALREAESLAETLDDPRRLGQVSSFLSFHFLRRGAYDQAIATGQRALALATAGGDTVPRAIANHYLGLAYKAQGDYQRAINCYKQSVASLEGDLRYERFGQGILPAVNPRAWLATCHAELGTFAEGKALGEEGLRIAETVAHPASLLMASWGIGLLALRQGDLHKALPLLERAVTICQDMDFRGNFPLVAQTLGAAYTLAGRVVDAVPLLTQAMEHATATETVVHQAICRLSLGEAYLLHGRSEEAQALAEQAIAHTRTHQERGNEAYALHLLGEIAVHRTPPDVDEATAHYRQLLTLAEELGMRPLQAHCHRDLGTLYANTGRQEQARAELSTAIEMYRAMDMAFWLPEAEAVLAQVEG